MTYEKLGSTPSSTGMGLSRLARFSLFFVSAGFAYPNVCSENLKATELDVKPHIETEKL